MGLFSRKKTPINLVIGINQVDNLGDWNDRINLPTESTTHEIETRAKDIIKKLSTGEFSVERDQIEYYSALRAFRLHELNGKLTRYCKDGALMQNSPVEFFDESVAPGMPEQVRKATAKAMAEEDAKIEAKYGINAMFAKLSTVLTKDELSKVKQLWADVQARPVRIAILGKCGVGKSTTVKNLFQGELIEASEASINTSRIHVGNSEAQYKHFRLPKGGFLTLVDLPGYGRSLMEDPSYQEIYLRELKGCDIILMIVQANSSDLKDDQIMLKTLIEWRKADMI